MLDDLKRMVIFTRVVEAGSFSGAAERLDIAKSAISKHVALLEKHVGARLLNRTTRGMNLTEAGENYYAICTRLVEAADAAQQFSSGLQDEPQGTLKIASPFTFGAQYIAPLLNRFLQQHPNLKAELLLDDAIIDMVREGIDVAIRVGWLPDSSFRARKLRTATLMLCASPEYLKKNGTPMTPDDLSKHEWIIFTLLPTPFHCTFTTKNGGASTVQVKGRIKSNNSNAVHTLLREGAGIATLSDLTVADDIKSGRLVHLLPDYHISDAGIYAVYQDQQLVQAKTRKFIDFLAEQI